MPNLTYECIWNEVQNKSISSRRHIQIVKKYLKTLSNTVVLENNRNVH